MIVTGQLNHFGSWNLLRQGLALLDKNFAVINAVENQAGYLNAWQDGPNINLQVHACKRNPRTRAGAYALQFGEPLSELLVRSHAGRDGVHNSAHERFAAPFA